MREWIVSLRRIAKWFDALSLRERLLFFSMAAGMVFLIADALFLSSVSEEQKRFSGQIRESKSTTKAIDDQIMALKTRQNVDPDEENRRKLEALRQKLAGMDASLQGMQQNLVSPDKMGKLLEDLLAHNSNLRLVAMKTLPVANMLVEKGAQDQQSSLLYKHGVQITVEGRYGDLLNYLTSVEHLPWRVFWGGITMSAGDYPKTTLTLTLYTLSLNKTWLSV